MKAGDVFVSMIKANFKSHEMRKEPLCFDLNGNKPVTGTKEQLGISKIAYKLPMCNRVIDVRGRFYHYFFKDGKTIYLEMGSVFMTPAQ